MGIWRSKKEFRAPSIGLDEFDPFPFESLEFEGTRISSIQKPAKSIHVDNRSIPSGSRSIQRIKSYFVYFVLAVATIASGFFVSKLKPWEMWATQEFVYAYFEVRALDQSGRPVAGALVKNSGKKVGTTDSFGEWRRYMKVPLGSTIPISVVKNHNGVSASAIKNFAVPPSRPDKADIELRSSIQLAAITPVAVSAVAQSDSVVVEKAEVAAKELNVSDKMPDASPVETATAISVSKPLANVENQLFQSSHESIWFETTASPSSHLSKEVIPALVVRSKELGLNVSRDAKWSIRLTGLLDKPAKVGVDGDGLIMVSSFDQNDANPREFLRNYQSDPRVTARGILYVLSHQVQKNVKVTKKGSDWFASLPDSSSQLWRLQPNMTLVSQSGVEFKTNASPAILDGKNDVLLTVGSTSPCDVSDECQLSFSSIEQKAPAANWVRIRAKLHDKIQENVKIFVSGYEAKSVSDNVVEYWGRDKARVNVTFVHAGRVVSRTQVINNSTGQLPIIAWKSRAQKKGF